MTFLTAPQRTRAPVLALCGFLSTSCLIELDDLKQPTTGDNGIAGGGGFQESGGTGSAPADGGSPMGDGGSSDSSGGGTGGMTEPEYGPNLIENGDFSAGSAGWDNGGLTPRPPPLMDGMGCTSDGGHTDPPDQFLGWSGNTGGTTLSPGTYRYEFTIRASGSPSVEIKVASTVPPEYLPWVFQALLVPPNETSTTYSYVFEVTRDEPQMGLLFNVQDGVGQVCVDDVSLRRVL